jgi:hypothetical protein
MPWSVVRCQLLVATYQFAVTQKATGSIALVSWSGQLLIGADEQLT